MNPNSPPLTPALLIAYTQALLPSLLEVTKEATTSPKLLKLPKLLWAVEDSQQADSLSLLLQKQDEQELFAMNSHTDKEENEENEAKEKRVENSIKPDIEISTLAKLSHQYSPQRFELACFWLPTMSAEQLQQFIPTIMRYRDLYAAHLLIAVKDKIDLRAYGFMPFDILGDQAVDTAITAIDSPTAERLLPAASSLTLWQFNLYDYKHLPNWLNSKYWANPENWDKYRW
ncbi:DUF6231 family protein [Psychrobacter sp. Ps3]|uniref:DUF6231 family protein n=1 Tax=Psychrobacter sp. Ps3 TaxID=2790957 RepID=UPI0022AA916A|nr:DUF6231 family protein [Psychrobacter sp. Ps3]MCG3882567.1 hypothetical protein [Psychrobacter sp. Ps3]